MKMKQLKWVYLITLALVWGSSFILIKRGLVGLTPMQLGSLRIIFAAIFLLLIGFKSLSKIPPHQWKYIALTATLGTFIPAFLFSIAQTQIDSSVSAILNSLTPLNTMILGGLAFGLNFKRAQVFGVIIGLIGTFLLIINGAIHHTEQNYNCLDLLCNECQFNQEIFIRFESVEHHDGKFFGFAFSCFDSFIFLRFF